MLGILNQTQSYNWKSEVQKYEQEKKALPWGYNAKPNVVSHKDVKDKDNIFNPILQVYKNKNYEDFLKHKEKERLIDTLARNKDTALRTEQTFNVISLQDKLQGLEGKPNYPRMKSENTKRKKLEGTRVNYNILSNYTLDKHNFLKPEERPIIDDKPPSRKVHTVSSTNYRDYDIISNKYKEFDHEKKKTEQEVSRLNAAKLYIKKNVYNPVQARFFDEAKEKAYEEKRAHMTQNWAKVSKKHLKGEGSLYNPINMSIVDDTELKIADKKARDKKRRYELRYDIETHYRNKGLEKEKLNEELKNKKLSYQRFKGIDERGFNILRPEDKATVDYKAENKKLKDTKSEWEKLIDFAGDNNTFQSKTIYKDPYDFTEVVDREKQFIAGRKKLLETLPNINSDNDFKTLQVIKKRQSQSNSKDPANNESSRLHNKTNLDKQSWFKTKKENTYREGSVEKVDYHQDKIETNTKYNIKSRPTLFIEKKLKNKQPELESSNS